MMIDINIGRDFTRFPGGRYRRHGPGSGEEFRDAHLLPSLQRGDLVNVTFGDVFGLPASFVEEAFGGLVRKGLDEKYIRAHLRLVAQSPSYQSYVDEAWSYINEAEKRKS